VDKKEIHKRYATKLKYIPKNKNINQQYNSIMTFIQRKRVPIHKQFRSIITIKKGTSQLVEAPF